MSNEQRREGAREQESKGWRLLAQSLLASLIGLFSLVLGLLWHRQEDHAQDDVKVHKEISDIEKKQADDIARREDADHESMRDRDEIRRRLNIVEGNQHDRIEDERRRR